jgi:hypothetical protein
MKLNTYLAYTNCDLTKSESVALALAHENADKYKKGSYETCSVGCMTGGKNHGLMPQKFGFDPRIAYVMDAIFEGLPNDEYKTFTAKVFSAMPEGADTSKVYAHFMAKTLRRAAKYDSSEACENVAKLMDLLVGGTYESESWAAESAAGWAAESAAESDASAAASAAEYQLQAQDLIDSCLFFGGKL